MSRIVWLLVFLVGAVLLVPQLRERARPQIEVALNPLYKWEAKNRVNSASRALADERQMGTALPRAREFTEFLGNRKGKDSVNDPWGVPMFMETTRTTYRIGSSGPDRARGTADDIWSRPDILVRPPR